MKLENKKALIFMFLIFVNLFCFGQHQISLSDADLEAFKQQTKNNINSLQNCIAIIGSKKTSFMEKHRALKTAKKLFIPGAKIEVSMLSPNGKITKKKFTHEMYFKRLSSLNYDEIVITFYDITYFNRFEMSPDKSYSGVVTIYQNFKGYREGKLHYGEVTSKNIEVFLQWLKDPFLKEHNWMLLLGDISVRETVPKYEDLKYKH